MEAIREFFQTLPQQFDLPGFLTPALILCGGLLVLGILGRLLFGKKSVLNQSVSAVIGILFIYAVTVVLFSLGVRVDYLVSPLPFIELKGDLLYIFPILSSDYTAICGHVLNMIILAFLVNLVNSWLPTGKKFFFWFLFRCISVVAAMALFTLANSLITTFLPADLMKWAPVILLAILVISLLLGALKFVVGAVLTTVNPLIAVLYTFFFASILGKQVSKAILSTLIFTALVCMLDGLGVLAISIGTAALIAYIPLLLVLLVLWYLIGRKM